MLPAQVIRINFTNTPFTLDPRKTTDPITTVTNHMFYEKLTRLNSEGTIELALAERVEISKDQKRYLFFLRKSLWSNGLPLTAHHFENAWKQALSPDFSSHSVYLLFPIQNAERAKRQECSLNEVGVKALNDDTLLIELERPTPYFLKLVSHPVYSPIPHAGEAVPYPHCNNKDPILTNGPFTVKSWKSNHELVAVKNPHYWNAKEVQIQEIHATIISDEATALKLFKCNKLDYVGGLISPLPMDAIPSLKEAGCLLREPIAGTVLAFFNIHQFPFHNFNIRKAFALAVNKKEIIENVTQMFDEVAIGLVPPLLKQNQPSSISSHDDSEEALTYFKKGLQELGISRKAFPPITYSFFNSELQYQLALAIQGQWQKALGVTIELKPADLKSYLPKLHSHQFEIAQMAWIAQYDDPLSFLERFISRSSHCNYSDWENVGYQSLIEKSFCQEGQNRSLLLEEAEQIIKNEIPNIPIYHYSAVYIKNPRLKGLAISRLGDIQFHKAFLDSDLPIDS